jgi:glutaredoxin
MKATVYSQNKCDWCDKVKDLLKDYSIDTKEINISLCEIDKNAFRAMGYTTVPQVFIDGTYVGGYEATVNFLEKV